MEEVCITSLRDYIDFISDFVDHTVTYRGAKNPDSGMTPSVVRSWRRNRRIRQDLRDKPKLELWDYEARLIEAFKRQALPFLETVPDCHLNWLAIAQHYHLPTRLLDWTRNPLIALYFAANNRGDYMPPEEWPDVYVFMWEISGELDAQHHMLPLDRVKNLRPRGQGRISDVESGDSRAEGIILFNPPLISSRIASQEGLFSFSEQLSERSFPEEAARSGLKVTQVTIPGPSRFEILTHLNMLGVETGRLFPDLTGLTAHRRWVAEWLW